MNNIVFVVSLLVIPAIVFGQTPPAGQQLPQDRSRQTAPPGQSDKPLGELNKNPYDPSSVNNPYGQQGNPYNPDSIKNQYAPFGSPSSPYPNPYGGNPSPRKDGK